MTQKLRYLGSTTAQFRMGEVYLVLLTIDKEHIMLCEPWGKTYTYYSLAHLLQFWQPATDYVPTDEDELSSAPGYAFMV